MLFAQRLASELLDEDVDAAIQAQSHHVLLRQPGLLLCSLNEVIKVSRHPQRDVAELWSFRIYGFSRHVGIALLYGDGRTILYGVNKKVEESYQRAKMHFMKDTDKPIPIRIPPDLLAKIELAAKRIGWSKQDTMREAMKLGLAHFKHLKWAISEKLLDASLSSLERNSYCLTSETHLLNETPTPYGDDIPVTVTIAKPAGADALNEAIALAERLAKASASAGPTKAVASPIPKESPLPRKRSRSVETGEK